MAKSIRDGRGHRAYRRDAARLRRRRLPCAWCGKPIDYDAPPTHTKSFTADHPIALKNGGKLIGQQLAPFHRGCNASKGKTAEPILRAAS